MQHGRGAFVDDVTERLKCALVVDGWGFIAQAPRAHAQNTKHTGASPFPLMMR